MVKKLIALSFIAFLYGSSFSMDWMKAVCYPNDKLSDHPSHHLLTEYDNKVRAEFPSPDVRNFLDTFKLPKYELGGLLAQQEKLTNQEQANFTWEGESYQGFYVKKHYPFSRVLCARRLKNLIESEGYTTVSVPDKYLFLGNNYGYCREDVLLAFARKVVPTDDKEIIIDRQQMMEFSDVVTKARFCDWNNGNFMIDDQKRIVFVDTEIRSFSHGGRLKEHNLKQIRRFFIPKDGRNCVLHGVTIKVADDAKVYLLDKIAEDKKAFESTCRSFTQKSEYDTKKLNVPVVYPLINTWSFEQNNSCKREAEIHLYEALQ